MLWQYLQDYRFNSILHMFFLNRHRKTSDIYLPEESHENLENLLSVFKPFMSIWILITNDWPCMKAMIRIPDFCQVLLKQFDIRSDILFLTMHHH